jgi:hypothetical protein
MCLTVKKYLYGPAKQHIVHMLTRHETMDMHRLSDASTSKQLSWQSSSYIVRSSMSTFSYSETPTMSFI